MDILCCNALHQEGNISGLSWVNSVAVLRKNTHCLHRNYNSCARQYVIQHLRICCCWCCCCRCCCILTALELEVRWVAWAGQSRYVRSVSRSVASSRQWWRCVPVPVTSSCPTASSRSPPSQIQSRAPERCKVQHFLQHNGILSLS